GIGLVLDGETGLEIVAHDPAQLAPQARDADSALGASDAVMGLAGVTDLQNPGQRRVSAGEVDHVLIAVAVPRYARDARKQVVGQLEVIAGAYIDALVGSGRQVDVAGIGAFGLLADQTHHAADGAAAKQRALRPAQDFHTVHVL